MKRVFVFIGILILSFPALAGYKLVFINGATLELKEKPDLTLRLIQGETLSGKAVIFPARFVDIPATHRLNEPELKPNDPVVPKPEPRAAKPMVSEKPDMPEPKQTTDQSGERLVITNDTIQRPVPTEEPETEASTVARQGAPRRNVETGVETGLPSRDSGYVDDAGRGESYWRSKFETNRNMIQRAEKALEDVKLELNRLVSERIQTDDEVYRRRLIGDIQELEKKKKNLEDQLEGLRREKENLKEEARRSGALPGWYRDYVD